MTSEQMMRSKVSSGKGSMVPSPLTVTAEAPSGASPAPAIAENSEATSLRSASE